jgi:dienelactone hydrolase
VHLILTLEELMAAPLPSRIIPFSLLLLLVWTQATAPAQLAPPSKEIPLYPGAAPGSESWTWSEHPAGSPSNPTIQNVVHPELMYYPADRTKFVGTAAIVAPGGGFNNLMMSYEGVDVAKRLNDMGVDAFVLKYRLKYSPASRGRSAAQPAPDAATTRQAALDIRDLGGADGKQAIHILRSSASDYGFPADRIGIVGFSAGGAVTIRAVRGDPDTRPNFAAMIYGADASAEPPPAGAPPMFIAVASDDQSVGFQNSLDLFSAWRKANVPVELHIFQTGAHGFRKKGGGADHFMDRLEEWMKVNGLLTKPVTKS